jgi:hypothetical protein
MEFSPQLDLPRLKTLCALVDEWITKHGDAIGRPEPSISGWSAEQHLAHLTLANELIVRNLKSLTKESGALVVREAAQSETALAILHAGQLPRGRAQSPRMVRPPEVIERELMLEWLADVRQELKTIDPAQLPKGRVFVPHQLLGPLDAPQWLRFGVVHTRHHMVIAREVLAAGGVPTAELEAI